MLPASYSCALIDASLFRYAFSEELKAFLSSRQVYVSETFETEVMQFRKLLFGPARTVLDDNLSFLGTMPQRYTIIQLSGSASGLNADTWGTINCLANQNRTGGMLLVSANYLLWQRLVLSGLPLDSYDPVSDRLYPAGEYAAMKSRVDFHADNGRLPMPQQVASTGTALFRKTGKPVVLGRKQHEGAEAILYWANTQEKKVAKIFWPDKLPIAKFRNIEQFAGMNTRMGISWAEFSWDILYYDAACTIPAGILENFIPTRATLGSDALYLGDLETAFRTGLDRRTIADTLQLCLQLVRQVVFLNQFGFFISDYNWDNFSTYDDNFTGNIQMWDTDSFGFGNYFSGMCANNILPTRQFDMTHKLDTFAFCDESLCSFVFSLFSLGDAPICEQNGARFFKYQGNDTMQGNVKQHFFPEMLLDYFSMVYNGITAPSPEMLMVLLERALGTEFANRSWREVLKRNLGLTEAELQIYTQEQNPVRPPQMPQQMPPQVPVQPPVWQYPDKTDAGKKVEEYQKKMKKQQAGTASANGGSSKKDETVFLVLALLLFVAVGAVILLLVFHKMGILCVLRPVRCCVLKCLRGISAIL